MHARPPLPAVAAALLSLALISPAHADVQRFTDPRNDTSSSVDIRSVRVDNSTADRSAVVVAVQQDDVRIGDSIEIFVDTRPADPGPEFSISGYVASEYVMHHRENWKNPGRMVPFRCGYRMRINEATDRTRVVMSRNCLGEPGKVRVAVLVERDASSTHDWAKARRTWLGWVSR